MKLPTPAEIVIALDVENKQLTKFLSALKDHMQNPDSMRKSLVSEENMEFKFFILFPLSDRNQVEAIENLNSVGWQGSVKDARNSHCPAVAVHIWPLDHKKVTA